MVVKRKTLRRKDNKKRRTVSKVRGGSNNYAAMHNFPNVPSKSLIEAVERRNLDEVKKFLADSSTDVNQKDDRGMTALHHAVEQRDQSIVKELLSHSGEGKKLDIDAMNNYNRTALFDAFMYSNHAMIELLIKHGANINIQNKDGKTILMMLLSSTKPNMEMIKLAMGLGSKLDIKDKKGETALDYAKKQLARANNSSMKNLVNSMSGQMGGRRKKRTKTRRLKK
jgi:ankyrin repeat protein